MADRRGVQAEPREDRVRDELLARCREELLEPPGPTRIARIVGSAMRQAEQALTTHIAAGIPVSAAARIRVLLGEADTDPVDGGDGGAEVFAQIRTDPGNVSLDTCVEEVSKLEAVRTHPLSSLPRKKAFDCVANNVALPLGI